jgi:hypothetical protein
VKAPGCPWKPSFAITPKAARLLMEIEAIRAEVARTPLPPTAEAELRRQARVRSTHYSTRIEGNMLSARYRQYMDGLTAMGPGRQRPG